MASTTSLFSVLTNEAMPIEFSQPLLSIFETDSASHDFIKELVYSLATRTQDTMLQYLCSAASFFPNAAIGFSALITSLIQFEPQANMNHLVNYLEILPTVFTRILNQMNQITESLNLQLPPSIQQLKTSLINPVKTIGQAFQSLVVFYNIDQIVPAESKEKFHDTLLTAVRVALSWIMTFVSLLRLNTVLLGHTAIEALEKEGKVDDDLLSTLKSPFGFVNTFAPSHIDISNYQPLLNYTAIVVSTLLPYIDKLGSDKPEVAQINQYKDGVTKYMNLLEESLAQLAGIPPDLVQQNAGFLLQNLYATVDYFVKALSEQPNMFASLQSDLKIQAFITFLMFDVLKAADTTKLKEMFTQLYGLENINDILHKTSQIQAEMQIVNQAIYGYTPQGDSSSTTVLMTPLGKKEIIKQTIVEVVKEVQPKSSEKPKRKKSDAVPPPSAPVPTPQPTGPVIEPPRKIDSIYYTLDFRNNSMLTNALALITNVESREATIADINDFLNNPEYSSKRAKLEDSVRKVLVMRAENQFQLDVAAITQMDEKTLFDKSLEIATVLPIYGGKEQDALHKLILPLYLQESLEAVSTAVKKILTLITYIGPLHERVNTIATIIKNEGRSVEPEISETVRIFQIQSRAKGDTERKREIFDLATFLAYANLTRIGEFCEYNVTQWLHQIRQKIKMETTRQITYDMVESCIATATVKQCFDVQIMRACRSVMESLDTYLNKQGENNRHRLIGSLCMLPTQFNPTGNMDVEWASALALITPTALNELMTISSSSLSSHLASSYSVQTVEEAEHAKVKGRDAKGLMADISSSSSSDEEDEGPEIIYEDVIEEEEVGEAEVIEDVEEVNIEEEEDVQDESNQDELTQARMLENVRNAYKLLKQYNDAAMNLEPAIVNARFEGFYLSAYDLIKLVPKPDGEKITEILKTSISVTKQIVTQNDRSTVSQLEPALTFFRQLKHSLTGKSSSGIVASEFVLLSNYSDQLYTIVEYDPTDDEMVKYDPYKRQIIIECRDILKSMRVLSRRAIKLIQQIPDLKHPKPLAKAISQTAESIQLFYLFIRNTEHEDEGLRSMISNGCRKMESALSCMVMLIPKDLPDDYNEIRSLNAEIVSHLDYMIDISDQKSGFTPKTAQQSSQQQEESSSTLTEKRLDAEALVIKRRKELSDAEAEVARLKSS